MKPADEKTPSHEGHEKGRVMSAERCIKITKRGVRCSLPSTHWGNGSVCGSHFHRASLTGSSPPSNEELASWVREAAENDPTRLRQVASLLVETVATPTSIGRTPLQQRLAERTARGWTRFRHKLRNVTSYAAAQALADAIPPNALDSERSFYLHLGRYIQTRVVPDRTNEEERTELEDLLLRLSISLNAAQQAG